ncbi:MAG: BMP family ABC transporter substrate-binding protein [Firmicutes bacterium]|nr:BMP family ABC transporter substrate-binding protein [Bacillota bacterium]
MKKKLKKLMITGLAAVLALSVASCGTTETATETASETESNEQTTIGFIFVGAKDDYGYNQAAYQGSVAIENEFGDQVKILRSENVPETSEATRVLEQMIQQGATILFPTSYGHLDPAIEAANNNPDCVFFHQGGLKNTDNVGTYFGTIWQAYYLAGMAAGGVTETNQLGFVASFPISQVLANINAFELGAKAVNPDVTTTVIFTGSWSDPAAQTTSATTLIDGGADVIAQHQDSTKTVIELCESRGVKSVGYHIDASELAPEGWVTAAIWNWDDLFVDMARTAIEGNFDGSIYDGMYRGGLAEGIVDLAEFGQCVPEDLQAEILEAKQAIIDGTLNPFAGEIKDQAGNVKVEAGQILTVDEVEAIDYLVEGVIGSME